MNSLSSKKNTPENLYGPIRENETYVKEVPMEKRNKFTKEKMNGERTEE